MRICFIMEAMENGIPATDPIQPPKPGHFHVSRKVLLFALVLLLLLSAAVYMYARHGHSNTPQAVTTSTAKTVVAAQPLRPVEGYDSAVGLLPPFHEGRVRSGKFSVQYHTPTGQPISREGEFTVNSDGRVGFAMIHNVDKVNSVLDYLRDREELAEHYREHELRATKYVSFNFADMAGYTFFHDPLTIVAGYLSHVSWAKDHPGTERAGYIIAGPTCDSASERAENLLGAARWTTKGMAVDVLRSGTTYTAKLNTDTAKQAHVALQEMLAACSRGAEDENDVSLLAMFEQLSTLASQVVYHKLSDNRWWLEIPRPEGETFALTVWDLSERPLEEKDVTISAYDRRTNEYGIIYDTCRVPPIIATNFMASWSYYLMPEAAYYGVPTALYSGYYCAPSLVPPGYSASPFYLKNGKETIDYVAETRLTQLQAHTELRYMAEQYFTEHGHYPNGRALGQMADGEGYLRGMIRGLIAAEAIRYRPLPEGCAGEACQDYLLTLELPRGTFRANSYQHPPADR